MSEIENAEDSSLYAEIEAEITGNKEDSAPPVEVEPEEQEETGSGDTAEAEPEPIKPKPDGFQKRIDKRTRDYYTEKAKREAAEAELAKLKSQSRPVDPEPTLEESDYDETEHQRKLAKYYANQAVSELRQESESLKKDSELESIISEHSKRVQAYGKDDWIEVTDPLINNKLFSGEVSEAIMSDDKSAEIVYHLGKNIELAEKLSSMSDKKAMVEIGKLSVKLSTVKPKKTTNAPKPVTTAGSGGSANTKSFDDKDADFSLEELDKMFYQ